MLVTVTMLHYNPTDNTQNGNGNIVTLQYSHTIPVTSPQFYFSENTDVRKVTFLDVFLFPDFFRRTFAQEK